ncbi:pseudouridine synthase [soil metagenome]
MIAAGRVAIGGEVVRDPARDVDSGSGVEVDGRAISPEPREVWLLHKPIDVVSTAREPGKRKAVTELIDSRRRLYPVGRLDADSTGLILLTNDGELANRLMHPRYGIERTYRAALRRSPTDAEVERLRRGVKLDDGKTRPARVKRIGRRGLELMIREGRNRQIRRMAEAMDNEVVSLKRIAFGPLSLGRLPEGEARLLGAAQVAELWKDAERNE